MLKLTQEDVHEVSRQVIVPFSNMYLSTLGGKDRASIMVTVSLDEQKTWKFHILENSRYFKMSINHDGSMELISGSSKLSKKFRKCKVDSVEKAIAKLNKYVDEVR